MQFQITQTRNGPRRYFVDGMRVSREMYELHEAQCTGFDTFITSKRGGTVRHYKSGRLL